MKIIDTIRPFVAAGFSLHWLREQSKAPLEDAWSTAAHKSIDDLVRTYREGLNVGCRLGKFSRVGGGYLHAIDLDIRDEDKVDEALSRLAAMFPNYLSWPCVISGSGGESRHFYFITDKPFASKKLARSEGYDMVFDPSKGRAVKKRHWEIELFGTGKQVAFPPSIHPDTGAEYAWHREFEFGDLELGLGPIVDSAKVESLAGVTEDNANASTDDRPAIGLTLDQAKAYLDDLPTDWAEDRDLWTQAGMALRHEFAARGLEGEAFELWCSWSAQSEKFDLNDARRVWVSFKNNKTRNVRMATVMQAARQSRFEREFDAVAQGDGFDDKFDEGPLESQGTDSIDDLLGIAPAAKANALDDLDDLVEKVSIKPSGAVSADWFSKLDFSDKGIKSHLPNIRLIVANDARTKGVLAYNEFSNTLVRIAVPGKLVKSREPAKGTKQLEGSIWDRQDYVNGDLWLDFHDNAVRDLIESPTTQGGYGIKVSDRDLHGAISLAASDNLFHPVRKYLNALEWDGTSRAETLFIRYFNAPDNAYTRNVARLMLIAGVTRIFEPGHKFDYAVILEGMQGKRKTTFIETLAQDWFGELASEFDNTNKMIESMQNAWIIEIPELSGFSKHDVQAIKAFISRRNDKARLAYARRAQDYPRQCIFIGSTNDAKYLRDETGGRRFWPIECLLPDDENIDIEGLREEVSQLWAEAVHLYREMRKVQPNGNLPLYLADDDARLEAERLQESRRVETVEDAMAGQISAWLEKPINVGDAFDSDETVLRNATCLKQVWVEGLGNDPRSFNAQAAQTVGRAMRLVKGWDSRACKIRLFGDYGKQRAYFRMTDRSTLEQGGEMIF